MNPIHDCMLFSGHFRRSERKLHSLLFTLLHLNLIRKTVYFVLFIYPNRITAIHVWEGHIMYHMYYYAHSICKWHRSLCSFDSSYCWFAVNGCLPTNRTVNEAMNWTNVRENPAMVSGNCRAYGSYVVV